MQPGEKTRAPLRTGESGEGVASRRLRLTMIFHPDRARIGASLNLGVIEPSGALRLGAAFIGREAPLFEDGVGLGEPHVSRRALKLKYHARGLELQCVSERSYTHLGPQKTSTMSLTFKELQRGLALRFGHGVVCWLSLGADMLDQSANAHSTFVGVSPQAMHVRRLIHIAANSDLPVLLRGESGVGKEVVATAIHTASARSGKSMVVLNMAALPETLAEAELFGSARGAFTGAEKRTGYFAEANKGTLLLDEIGDLPVSIQPKLLRALQTGEIQVVGGRPTSVDARIIAASDANLDDTRGFKHALLQRLSGITIELPALRERREDVGILLATSEQTKGLFQDLKRSPREAAAWANFLYDALHKDWPGNVRELLLSAQRFALSLQHNAESRLAPRHFVLHTRNRGSTTIDPVTDADITAVYEQSEFEVAETARRLGLSRAALYRRVATIPAVRLAADCSDTEILTAVDAVGRNLQALSRELRISKAAIASRLRLIETRPT